MTTDERTPIPTRAHLLAEARRQWNTPAESGNTEDTLLLLKYTMRVCACAMHCDHLSDDDRDAVYLLLDKAAILCDIVSFTEKKS